MLLTKPKLASERRFVIMGGRPLIFLACAIMFIDTMGYGVVVPMLPMFSREVGMTEFKAGVLFASYAVALLLGSVPLGIISDRTGRKPMVLFGMFGTLAASLLYAHALTFPGLLCARALDGLTNAATWTAALSLAGDRFEEGVMGRMMGYIMAAMGAGGIAGPLLGGVLSDALGYRSPFYLIAAACLVGGVAGFFLREDRALLAGRHVSIFGMFKQVLKSRLVLVACLVTTLTTIGVGLLDLTFPLYLDERFSASRTQIGLLFGVLMIFYALASPLAGRYSDVHGQKKPVVAGLLLTALFAPFLGIAPGLPALYLLMVLIGASFAAFGTPILTVVVDACEQECNSDDDGTRLGTAFSLLNVAWSTGYIVGPLVGGAVMGWLGFIMVPILYSILLLALSVLAIREL